MTNPTAENFRAAILELADSEGRKPQVFAQGLTLVPNTLLEAVAEEGARLERERIIDLLGDFWCGEIACTKHPVRMDWVINAIKGDKND